METCCTSTENTEDLDTQCLPFSKKKNELRPCNLSHWSCISKSFTIAPTLPCSTSISLKSSMIDWCCRSVYSKRFPNTKQQMTLETALVTPILGSNGAPNNIWKQAIRMRYACRIRVKLFWVGASIAEKSRRPSLIHWGYPTWLSMLASYIYINF